MSWKKKQFHESLSFNASLKPIFIKIPLLNFNLDCGSTRYMPYVIFCLIKNGCKFIKKIFNSGNLSLYGAMIAILWLVFDFKGENVPPNSSDFSSDVTILSNSFDFKLILLPLLIL